MRACVRAYVCVCVCVCVCCSPQPAACLCAHVLLLVGVEADEQPLVYQQVRQSRVCVDLSRQQQQRLQGRAPARVGSVCVCAYCVRVLCVRIVCADCVCVLRVCLRIVCGVVGRMDARVRMHGCRRICVLYT